MKARRLRQTSGFTIIEVLIVLAIAAVILLVVLIAVPSLQRNARNYARKAAVDYVAAEMENYYPLHARFPWGGFAAATDDRTDFVNSLKNGGQAKDFTIVYTDSNMNHTLPYDGNWDDSEQTVFIMPGHFCQRDLDKEPGSGDYPVQGSDATSDNPRFYSVVTVLEKDYRAYCVDNRN